MSLFLRWVAFSCLGPWLKITVLWNLKWSGNRSCRFNGKLDVLFWLVLCLLVGRLFLSLRLFSSASSLVLLLLSSLWLAPRNRRVHLALSLSLSLLSLDDLTMPPYSPRPLPPLTPLSGNINIFLAESKCWLWLVLLFLLFLFSSSVFFCLALKRYRSG